MEERDGIPEDIMAAGQIALQAAWHAATPALAEEAIARAMLVERIRSLEAAKAAVHCTCSHHCDFDEAEEKIDELIAAIRNP